MKRTKTILAVILLVITAVAITSCSELHSEFDPHKWRYQPYRDMSPSWPYRNRPPSWENDFGRPGPEYKGEDMFGDTL